MHKAGALDLLTRGKAGSGYLAVKISPMLADGRSVAKQWQNSVAKLLCDKHLQWLGSGKTRWQNFYVTNASSGEAQWQNFGGTTSQLQRHNFIGKTSVVKLQWHNFATSVAQLQWQKFSGETSVAQPHNFSGTTSVAKLQW